MKRRESRDISRGMGHFLSSNLTWLGNSQDLRGDEALVPPDLEGSPSCSVTFKVAADANGSFDITYAFN
ncbi:hypothetical protein CVT26_008299 [Gymnopilus dilepis]|uniref:Uncharacterized protein n=1 Tax=Gymnopilus dilepis TaxID=231916 RepID=A0A409W9E8_9AGAR|nr:hypothetical protein CVT26_008299 [Gymnopilus dilepis]